MPTGNRFSLLWAAGGISRMYVCVRAELLSRVQLSVTLWTLAHQAPLTMGFSRQEYWTGLPRPLPVDLPDAGNWTRVSYISRIGRWVLDHQSHLGSPVDCTYCTYCPKQAA